ncbi:TIGR03086 family metal-binding protein [Kribbella sp. NPDC000426]|uniref:TIGR03086 family metal-binding protein n=1 Tax=Kribbella sp. NPDC000426 TaxID=3154255 RepID=UPI00332C9871
MNNFEDPRPMFVRALDQAQQLMESVRPEELGLPTPCTEYDVRTLLGHLLTVVGRIDLALSGEDIFSIPTVTETEDVAGLWKERRTALEATLAADDVLERVCRVPWGTVSGAVALVSYARELATHSWDLAKATGRLDVLDDGIATYLLPMSKQYLPAEPRGGQIPFGPVVPVADDAPPYDQLVAWQGRQP